MRKFLIYYPIFLVVILSGCNLVNTQPKEKINWITFDELQDKMKTEPRKVFVDVYATWCGPCKLMDRHSFSDKEVIKYINQKYYAVKWDAESKEDITYLGETFINKEPNKRYGTHELTYQIASINGKISYPTLVFMNEDFKTLMKKATMLYPDDFLADLKFFGDNIYEHTSYQKYIEDYYRGVDFE